MARPQAMTESLSPGSEQPEQAKQLVTPPQGAHAQPVAMAPATLEPAKSIGTPTAPPVVSASFLQPSSAQIIVAATLQQPGQAPQRLAAAERGDPLPKGDSPPRSDKHEVQVKKEPAPVRAKLNKGRF